MAVNEGKATLVLSMLIIYAAAFSDFNYRPTPNSRERTQYISDTIQNTPSRLGTRNADEKRHDHVNDDPIIYPDSKPKFTCTHGLCVNVPDYPKDRIRKLLNRSNFTNGYFETSEEFVNVDNRFNTDEMSLCDTKVHTIYPEKANNTNKIEKVIVNVEGHKQGIVFETCVSTGVCKFSSNFPTGYSSFCKQQYVHKRLMVLGDNNKFVFDLFEVPSCCVCKVTRMD